MAKIITLGCKVADVHHRYAEIHGALFGASAFRLVIVALRGKRGRTYAEYARTLDELQDTLATLETQIADSDHGKPAGHGSNELRRVLIEYTRTLRKAVSSLSEFCRNLKQDEVAYRDTGDDGGSRFNRDKVRYDQLLLELERLGTKLNKLFASY